MQLHRQRPLPSQSQNELVPPLRGIKTHAPRGGGGGPGSGYGFDMQYLHTHNRTHTPTRTHTQYIISILNYVLFLCMVQEKGDLRL